MVEEHAGNNQEASADGSDRTGMIVSCIIIALFVCSWIAYAFNPNTGTTVVFLLMQVAVVSIVIWQACDPFADVAQWIGDVFQLPGSVRGATLDAIASSMPELFSGILFVVVAVSAVQGEGDAAVVAAGAEGYGSTIATCAGSAVYNMMLIPAFCALVIAYTRKNRPTIDIEDEVVARDGLWFVACELLLIVFLFQDTMIWWMGVVFVVLYLIYIFQLYNDALTFRRKMAALEEHFRTHGSGTDVSLVIQAMREHGVIVSPALVMKAEDNFRVNNEVAESEATEDAPDSAGFLFGYFQIPLNGFSAAMILSASTLAVVVACYFLVEATLKTASILEVPAFFIAVILAAAASSVPDTFLAIGAARRGDDSGAVSNAFGSNIFDICICLSIPLFVNSYLTGWQPVSLLQDGKAIPGLIGLRILLVALTIITLLIMWHNRQLTQKKAWLLCGLYLVFLMYAVLGSLGFLV